MNGIKNLCVIGVILGTISCGGGSGGVDPGRADPDGAESPDAAALDLPVDIETTVEPGGDAVGEAVEDSGADLQEDRGSVEDLPMDTGTDTGLDATSDAPTPICCLSDAQCPHGWECVPIPGEIGVCKPVLESGACWSGADCGLDQVCVGAVPCRCGQDDSRDGCDIPGQCRFNAGECCDSDWDCPAHQVCTPGNVCWTEPAPGECWTDADCYATQRCEGAAVCPCGMDCDMPYEGPGHCAPLYAECCYSDDDCGDGEVCRFVDRVGHLPGRCVPSHLGPKCLGDAACCWEDDDCPGGFCQGAHGCGCVALCPVCGACAEDQMGFCANWAIQVNLGFVSATCEPSEFHPAFTTFQVSLAWFTSVPARSTIEVALNAFTGLEGSIPVGDAFQMEHTYNLSLSHGYFAEVPRVGDVIRIRVRVIGEDGGQGLSEALGIEVTQAVRDCLYPFDATCSDGGPIRCRAVPPPCDDDKVMAAIAGCERCVFPATCTCDDGSEPLCAMPPPTCEGDTILAVQHGCFECVSPLTCHAEVR